MKVGQFQRRWSTNNKDGSPYNKQDSYQNTYQTLGFRPTCSHYDVLYHFDKPRTRNLRKRYQQDAQDNWFRRARRTPGYDHWKTQAAVILDPFCGSGTVALVARQEGRSAIGMDLSYQYLRLARKRLSLDKLDAWEHGNNKTESAELTDLPLFKETV